MTDGSGAPAPAPSPSPWERVRSRWEFGPVSVGIVAFTVGVWLAHEALITWAGVNTDLSLQDNGLAIHGQYWRLFTPMVVHYQIDGFPSFVHLGLNMWALWQIGPPVEKVIGRWLFGGGYLLSGAGGQVLTDLHYGQGVVSGGASGAVFGVIGMLIGNYVVTTQLERMGRRSHQQWRFNQRAAKSLGIQGVVWIVATSVLIPGIDNWAHIGGAVVGLVMGGGVAWQRTRSRPRPTGPTPTL